MQDVWLAELRRIVKPDGVLIITLHGRKAAQCLPERDRVALESQGFLHKTSRKLSGWLPDWYHTTWHSQNYILQKLSALFNTATYFEVTDVIQDCVLASGPLDARKDS